MDREKKQEFQLRISQANTVGLIIILYEMAICYIDDGIKLFDAGDDGYKAELEKSRECVDEMLHNLHYEYPIARDLKQIYLYIKKSLRECLLNNTADGVRAARDMLEGLKNSYEQIKDADTSMPAMANTQKVITGMTYGRDSSLQDINPDLAGRGFTI